MRFPKQELDVDKYLEELSNLLNDEKCHIFIDTNIISQLYHLNKKARDQFYDWVKFCKDRFHIPNWVVHEFSKRVINPSEDYLSEFKESEQDKQINSLKRFKDILDEYIDESLISDKGFLIKNIESAIENLKEIKKITKKDAIDKQIKNVYKEIFDNFKDYVIDTNIYNIMENISLEHMIRREGKISPGFEDVNKKSNIYGDLIIWKEILYFCREKKIDKVIFISKDQKKDMVYSPTEQTPKGREKLKIANESLVYEFKLNIGTENFYYINFETLVKLLSEQNKEYNNLAFSLQTTEKLERQNDQQESDKQNITTIEPSVKLLSEQNKEYNNIAFLSQTTEKLNKQNADIVTKEETNEVTKYSENALADTNYDTTENSSIIDQYIAELRSHNWYRQNDAIKNLMTLNFRKGDNTQQTKDTLFVLGRNVLQSAEGAAYEAINFIENLKQNISKWDASFQEYFIEGLLYEIFFNSEGRIRSGAFKANYFSIIIAQIKSLKLEKTFNFVNDKLKDANRFTPIVGSNQKYEFEFEFNKTDENDLVSKTEKLMINKQDASGTFTKYDYYQFNYDDNLKKSLSAYYAIPEENIILKPDELENREIKYITYIPENGYNDSLPF